MNHFRAIAIVLVVASHNDSLGGLVFDAYWEQVARNLIAGATALFVFISGFFFHHIFYRRYAFQAFVTGKLKNLLIPYLILAAFPILVAVLEQRPDFGGMFLPVSDDPLGTYLVPALKYLWSGRFLTAYWYIPFILVTFLMSPLHMAFIRLPGRAQVLIVAALLIVAAVLHRPVANLHVFQSVVYFAPVYLIGILASLHRERIYAVLSGKEYYLLAAAIGLALLQASIGHIGNYHKAPFEFAGIDIMIFQKVFLCFFFMIWLRRFENVNNTFVTAVSQTSFAIYFIHPYVKWAFEVARARFGFQIDESWVLYAVGVLLVVAFCVACAKLAKLCVPRGSRYVVGY